jgi:DNA-binding IclR family transcriptional regulator
MKDIVGGKYCQWRNVQLFLFRMAESVQSVGRALDLLEHLGASDGDMSLADLARATGLQPPTAHRLLQTLVQRDWVVRNPSTTHYRLSRKLLSIVGDIEARTARLRALARPHLIALRNDTGESTNLVVLDGLAAVYIDQVPSQRPIHMFTEIGARVPAYASGAGKAMLAFQTSAVDRALGRHALEALTDHTLTDYAALKRALRQARARGYAFDNEEYELGVACTAAPIRGGDGIAVAAISVSAPAVRWRAVDRARLGRQVAQHADEISALLRP